MAIHWFVLALIITDEILYVMQESPAIKITKSYLFSFLILSLCGALNQKANFFKEDNFSIYLIL